MAARYGPPKAGEPSLTLQQAAELARLIARADSFVDARTLVEDAPDDVLQLRDRWVMVDALDVAAQEANEEVDRYKEALGFSKKWFCLPGRGPVRQGLSGPTPWDRFIGPLEGPLWLPRLLRGP